MGKTGYLRHEKLINFVISDRIKKRKKLKASFSTGEIAYLIESD
jgi:hypothetical protein